MPLTDYMAGEGKDVTLPGLDVKDFIGKSSPPRPDEKLYQLPDQQFANLYWFRYDWFARPGPQGQVQGQVRLRPRRAGQLVGLRGHRRVLHQRRQGDRRQARSTATWTTARRTRRSAGASPMPGCRWPATATRASRTASRSTSGASASEGCTPVGAVGQPRRRDQRPGGRLRADEVHRLAEGLCAAGGDRHDLLRGRPGAWPRARSRSRSSGTRRSPPTSTKPGLPVVNADGTPKWRMAPSPHGPVLEGGHEARLPGRAARGPCSKSTPVDRRKAAWLYAQFIASPRRPR